MMNHASPISKHENEGHNFEDTNDESFQTNGWCCFGQSCFRQNRGYHRETDGLLGEGSETWLGERFKKLKEFSEVLAGPKWKNFIRKISKHFNKRKTRKGQFQYDAESYALNFNDGVEDEDDGSMLGFSARFAGPVITDERHANLGS